MRIGVDATPLNQQLTGVGYYVHLLLQELIKQRPEDHFYLYAIRPSPALETYRQHPHVHIRYGGFFGFSEALWSQTTLAAFTYLDKIDVFWGATQSVPLFSRALKVLTIYDFAYRLYPHTVSRVRGSYLRLLSQTMYQRADALLTISQGTASRLEALYGMQADGVIIPPLKKALGGGAEGVLKKYGLKERGYFLIVGTLEPRKNIINALRAYQEMCAVDPLVIVGKVGWRDGEIQKSLLRASERVHLLGYLEEEELSALMRGAKAYVMPSVYEGYGMPLAEARALGTPVIACRVPEMVEAAEGDGVFIDLERFHEGFQEALLGTISPPTSPTYPSVQALAKRLSSFLKRKDK